VSPLLLAALRRFCEAAFSDWLMDAPGGGLSAPRVFTGAVPDDIGDEEAFPCAVVRAAECESTDSDDVHEFRILIGVHGPRGASDVEELLCAVSQRMLLRLRSTRVLEERWELVRPVRVTRHEPKANEKRNGYDVAVITTRWRELAPDEPLEV